MKLKRILALVCSLVMLASTSLVANAAVDGATATLEFAGYETKGTTTFAVINVKATLPDTLVPYELVAADWETTFEDTYKGLAVKSVGFDIPKVDGLTYITSLSSCAEYVQIQDNTTTNKITIYAANTGSPETYYAGTIDTLATLYYRITGDVNATYNLALTDAVIWLTEFSGSGTLVQTDKGYTFNDFTVTNAVVKPAVEEPTTATVTINKDAKSVVKVTDSTGAEVATGATVETGTVLTVSTKPWAGYKISSVTGVDPTNLIGIGGSYTFEVTDDTIITVAAEEVTNAPVTIAAAYVDADTKTNIVFGKASDVSGEYGIKLENSAGGYTIPETATFNPGKTTWFAAKNNNNGYFAINFHGLAADTYTATAYQGAEGSNGIAAYGYTFVVAE